MGRGLSHAPVLSLPGTAVPGARGATSTPSPVPGLRALSVHISQPGTCTWLPGLSMVLCRWVRWGGRAHRGPLGSEQSWGAGGGEGSCPPIQMFPRSSRSTTDI